MQSLNETSSGTNHAAIAKEFQSHFRSAKAAITQVKYEPNLNIPNNLPIEESWGLKSPVEQDQPDGGNKPKEKEAALHSTARLRRPRSGTVDI